MTLPRAVLFDLDDTLAPSFVAPVPAMITRLEALLTKIPLAIVSGAGYDRIDAEVMSQMSTKPNNLYIFPNSAAQCFVYRDGTWNVEYNHLLTPEERTLIKSVLDECIRGLDVIRNTPSYGERVVDREGQIAFTGVGLEAPPDIKRNWDPTGMKRREIVEYLQERLPNFEILIGGASTIDITRKNQNKSQGVEWMSNHLDCKPSEMLYVGDALYEGGNDFVVVPTGIQTRIVSGPDQTAIIIDELLASFNA